ncbi:MAG: methionyl-tRNA formyltransferase [Firmicutes bacterium]|nr:methionyl-tRNA formyltransferase [Bacillota bacterium]
MKIVFLGTPEFAVTALEKIFKSNHEVIAVISQPDRAKDRKGNLISTPVKQFAEKFDLPLFQFEKIKQHLPTLKIFDADVFITCAYGQILSQEILSIPKFGVLNIHASILPKYRGAAPIQWALINGEKETGVTIMQTSLGIDCGDIIYQKTTKIEIENAEQLTQRLSGIGADAIIEALKLISDKNFKATPQNEKEASHYPMLKKSDGKINFSKSAESIYNLIKGVYVWPTAYADLSGKALKIFDAEILDNNTTNKDYGVIISSDSTYGLIISCGQGSLKIKTLQIQGGKKMETTEFLNGNKIDVGTKLL